MSSTSFAELVVQTSKDKMSAMLQIPAGYSCDMLTTDSCAAQFEASGAFLDRSMIQQIEQGIAAFKANNDRSVQITLSGKPPVNGKDGCLKLTKECRQPTIDQFETNEEADCSDIQTPVDHYARSPFILIEQGQCIGKIIPPTDGEDGVDITGTAVPARPGKPLILKPHDSIMIDAHGSVIAQCSGNLDVHGHAISVNTVLRVEGSVDFETGNIDFDGDVEVEKGVCDNFKVIASRNAVIKGVVEAAELEVGGDLKLVTGMFAKEKGQLIAGQTCHAKFLQQTRAYTGNDLVVDREIVNCELLIHGGINSPHAKLIGGDNHAYRAVNLKSIGSEQAVPTVLHLGSLPEYSLMLTQAMEQLDELAEQAHRLQTKIDAINSGGSRIAAQHKEDMTELWCNQIAAQERHDKLKEQIDTLTQRFHAVRQPTVTVQQIIHPESKIVFNQTAAHFTKPVRGPITIRANRQGELAYRNSPQEPLKPIRSLAQLIHWS